MTFRHKADGRPSLSVLLLPIVGFVLIVAFLLAFNRPDRPRPVIEPGASQGPAFAVQIIRPRMGLPLGGLLPPQLFGVDAKLEFDSASDGASSRAVSHQRIELGADDWSLVIVLDEEGQITSDTEVVFNLIFEERLRRVRCRPDDPPVGTMRLNALDGSKDLAGSFHIELVHCEDAETGVSLGWPPEPLVLHGSFDRVSIESAKE